MARQALPAWPIVPVPAFVTRLQETEIAGRDGGALVFDSARGGGHLTPGQARYAFIEAATVGGMDGVRLHDLRQTCAYLASVRANVKVVQRLLRRKTAVLTLDRYRHLFPGRSRCRGERFRFCCGLSADDSEITGGCGGRK
jgi:integrase